MRLIRNTYLLPNTTGALKITRKEDNQYPYLTYSVPNNTTLCEEMGRWYKAYHIHDWFVRRLDLTDDDVGETDVSKRILQELHSDVSDVLESVELVASGVTVGLPQAANAKDRLVIADTTVAERFLPVRSGWFGWKHYDQHYVDDLYATLRIVSAALDSPEAPDTSMDITYRWS